MAGVGFIITFLWLFFHRYVIVIFGVVFSLPQYYMCYHMLFLCVIRYYAYIILYVDNECVQQYILAAMETIRSSYLMNSEAVCLESSKWACVK